MKKSRFTEEEMVGMLREADRTSIAVVSKAHDVSEQTLYTWRKRFGAMDSNDVATTPAGARERPSEEARG